MRRTSMSLSLLALRAAGTSPRRSRRDGRERQPHRNAAPHAAANRRASWAIAAGYRRIRCNARVDSGPCHRAGRRVRWHWRLASIDDGRRSRLNQLLRPTSGAETGERRSRLSAMTSGDFRSATDDDVNSKTGVTQHGDQGIDAEPINLASNQIADSRLQGADQGCRLRLCEPPTLDHLAKPNHQIGSDLEVFGF